jgi:hypothetical protein
LRNGKPTTLSGLVFDHASMMLSQGGNYEILNQYRGIRKSRFLIMVRMAIKFLFLTFAFACFVISSTYTAELTNILIQRKPRLKYTSIEDILLGDGKIIIPDERQQYFRYRWNIDPETRIFENTDSYKDAVEMLMNGSFDGFVGNRVTLQWLQNMNGDNCMVSLIPSSDINYYGPVIAWSTCMPKVVIQDVNRRIVEMEMDGEIERIAETSLREFTLSGYQDERPCVTSTTTIGLNNVGGVFVILGCGVFLPVCLFIVKYIMVIVQYFRPIVFFEIEESSNSTDSNDDESRPTPV